MARLEIRIMKYNEVLVVVLLIFEVFRALQGSKT